METPADKERFRHLVGSRIVDETYKPRDPNRNVGNTLKPRDTDGYPPSYSMKDCSGPMTDRILVAKQRRRG